MKTVFMGTPDFAAVCLKKIIESDNEVCLVITQPDKAKDRGKKIKYTPVKELALEHDIRVIQPERLRGSSETIKELKKIAPDIIVVVAYGQILPKEILELPKFGCINVHASLLPVLRGAAPIHRAIIEGYEETGVTIMQMDEGLDTGDMLSKAGLKIGNMNYEELHDKLAELGGELLIETLELIKKGEVSPEKQDDSKATYADRIFKKEGNIDFSKCPVEIERLIRALGATAEFNEKGDKIKFWQAEPIMTDIKDGVDGEIIKVDDNSFTVKCGGSALKVSEIQVPGKKKCKVSDYLRGNKLEVGLIFRCQTESD